MKKILDFCQKNLAWVLLVILVIFFSVTSDNFLSARNLFNIFNQNCYILIAAFGISLIMMSGGMDLSIGYQMAVAGVLSAKMCTVWGVPLILTIIVTILMCMAMCVLNAVLSHLLGIPRIFVTFGTMTIYQGLAYILSESKTIGNLPEAYKFIGQAKIGSSHVSIAMIITIVFCVIISVILNKTYFGRYVFALGGNPDAARLAGINVKKTEIIISAIAGFFLGVATITLVGRIGSATASTGVGTEFSVITGLLLGGVSIRGGEGKINGCVAGILIIALLGNGMQMAEMNIYLQYVVKGIIMLATIGFDTYQMKKRSIVANARHEEPAAAK